MIALCLLFIRAERRSERYTQSSHDCGLLWTSLTLPLTISHLCENYLPLPISHLCEIHMCACINCNGDISLHAWLKIPNQNGQ